MTDRVQEDQEPVDLLEQLRSALDDAEPLVAGRIVDIEMARVRIVGDPAAFRAEFGALLRSALADAEPDHAITVRVSRVAGGGRIDLLDDEGGRRPLGSMTVALAPGGSHAADG